MLTGCVSVIEFHLEAEKAVNDVIDVWNSEITNC